MNQRDLKFILSFIFNPEVYNGILLNDLKTVFDEEYIKVIIKNNVINFN